MKRDLNSMIEKLDAELKTMHKTNTEERDQ